MLLPYVAMAGLALAGIIPSTRKALTPPRIVNSLTLLVGSTALASQLQAFSTPLSQYEFTVLREDRGRHSRVFGAFTDDLGRNFAGISVDEKMR